jgi:hypothetical protein
MPRHSWGLTSLLAIFAAPQEPRNMQNKLTSKQELGMYPKRQINIEDKGAKIENSAFVVTE